MFYKIRLRVYVYNVQALLCCYGFISLINTPKFFRKIVIVVVNMVFEK